MAVWKAHIFVYFKCKDKVVTILKGKHLKQEIKMIKRRGKHLKDVILLQYRAPLHISKETTLTLKSLVFELLNHLVYLPSNDLNFLPHQNNCEEITFFYNNLYL